MALGPWASAADTHFANAELIRTPVTGKLKGPIRVWPFLFFIFYPCLIYNELVRGVA